MKKDLSQAVHDVASFMEIDLPSENNIAKIIDLTTFDNDQTVTLVWVKNIQDANGRSMFLRKGPVGDWKNYIPYFLD